MRKIIIKSQCCNAPVLIRGKTTLFYLCSRCLRPCEGYGILSKKEINKIRKNEDF